MNQTNVLVPDPTADEALVVDRFIEASRDLVPSVQISLAKRIVNADSNQVICLAAHTSVPLHPNDASSVSDLALKLSDGTNVRLSLKFFNDALPCAAGEYIPLTRNLYDPNRYEVKNRSRFPAILALTLLIAGLASYRYFTAGENSRMPLPFKTAAATTAPQQAVAPATKVATNLSGTSSSTVQHSRIGSQDVTIRPARAQGNRVSSKEPRQKLSATRQHHGSELTAYQTKSPPSMFVPPPPPMALPLTANGAMTNIDFGAYTLVPSLKPSSMLSSKAQASNKSNNIAQVTHSAKFADDSPFHQSANNSPSKKREHAPSAMRITPMEQIPDTVQIPDNASNASQASVYGEQRIDPLAALAPAYSAVKGAPQPGNNETVAPSYAPLERVNPNHNSTYDPH